MDLPYSDKELIKAKNSLIKMKEIKDKQDKKLLIEFESNWIDFLNNLEKIWKKSELECREFSNFQPWQGSFVRERKRDPLLKYLKNARDADQHSIQEITLKIDWKIDLETGKQTESGFEKRTEFNEGEAITLKSIIQPPTIEAVAFKNFDVVYEPPLRHLLIDIENPKDPIEIAELGVKYYEDYLKKIKKKF